MITNNNINNNSTKLKRRLFFISVIQIFLLIFFIPSNCYIIRENSNFVEEDLFFYDKNDNSVFLEGILNNFGSFLMSFFSIKQFGIVSANSNGDEEVWCCSETKEEYGGAKCQPIFAGNPDGICSEENIKQMPCQDYQECKIGTCIDENQGTCSSSSKILCEVNGGLWDSRSMNAIQTCQYGCCEVRGVRTYITEGSCKILALENGKENYDSFNGGISERDCRILTDERGACLLDNRNCRVTTERDCVNNLKRDYDDFREGYLCTNPEFNTICEKTEKTICHTDGKVYFLDSCDNRANVYDSNKIEDGDYWNRIYFSNEVCNVNLNIGSSVRSCGNCLIGEFAAESTCVLGENEGIEANYGDYVCRDTRCSDEKGNTRLNGERWCVYESYVGNSRDVVGSLHWIASCNNGIVNYEMTDRFRGRICGEALIMENNKEISFAISRGNEGYKCLQANEDMEIYEYDDEGNPKDHETTFEKNNNTCLSASSDCRIESVQVDGRTREFPIWENWYEICTELMNEENSEDEADDEDDAEDESDDEKYSSHEDCMADIVDERWYNLCESYVERGLYHSIIECLNDSEISGSFQPNEHEYFKFDVCVPEYPKGFDISPNLPLNERDSNYNRARGEAEDVCKMANIDCTYIERKNFWGNWKCKANCECKEYEFTEEMNDLCVSLGDCGGYVNIAGVYTDGGFYSQAKNFPSGGSNVEKLEDKYLEYSNEDKIGEGNLPLFFSSTFRQEWFGEDLPDVFVGSIKDFSEAVKIAGGTVGGLSASLAIYGITQSWNPLGWIALFVAAALSFVPLFSDWGKTREKTVKFECLPWKPPQGGDDCYKCNEHPYLPCNEYRCESLGSACRIVTDVYETENPLCLNVVPNDIIPPKIEFVSVISDLDKFNLEGEIIKDSGREIGLEVKLSDDRLIEINTPVHLRLVTKDENNEREIATCRYTFSDKPSSPVDYSIIKDWNFNLFDQKGSYSEYHDLKFKIPGFDSGYVKPTGGTSATGRIGEFDIHISCSDIAGNWNALPYTVRFSIREVDTSPPMIMEFNPSNGSYLVYGETEKHLEIKLNEPSECRWSSQKGDDFENMNDFDWCEFPDEQIIKSRWSCSNTFTDLDKEKNNIWIKCRDHPQVCDSNDDDCDYEGYLTPEDRNTNKQDTLYTIYQTSEKLEISSIYITRAETINSGESSFLMDIGSYSPRTIYAGKSPVEIKIEANTIGGIDNGNSICRYSFISSGGGDFFYTKTGGNEHLQYPLYVLEGMENITITCTDDAGNIAKEFAIFDIKIDTSPPEITRVYKDINNNELVINTDENAKCYYHPFTCNFNLDEKEDNVEVMTLALSKNHRATWNVEKNYYIRCEDIWGNTKRGCTVIISSVK